jgi:hypothetical protein
MLPVVKAAHEDWLMSTAVFSLIKLAEKRSDRKNRGERST